MTMQPTTPLAACAFGATAEQSLSAPHSSGSKWLNDPAQSGRIDQLAHAAEGRVEHPAHPGVHQERLLVAHQELVELYAEVGMERADPEDVRRDLVDARAHQSRNTTGRRSRLCIQTRREHLRSPASSKPGNRASSSSNIAGFQTRQRRSQAQVLAEAEGQVAQAGMVAADVEAVGLLAPDLLVAVGRGVEQQQHLPLADPLPAQLGVARRGADEALDGGPPAQHLLHRVGKQAGLGEQPPLLVGIPHQEQRAAGDQVAGGLVAGGEQRDAEHQDLGVVEPDAVDLGAGQRRDQVVLGGAPALAQHAREVPEHLAQRGVRGGVRPPPPASIMASDQRLKSARSLRGTPSISAITYIGSGTASASTRSICSPASTVSRHSRAIWRTIVSSSSVAPGVKAWITSLR
jgi:hypothetical protein